jgi:taurine dioxygenase
MKNAADRAKVNVEPMTVHIGAEISGVDLTRPLESQHIYDIRRALLKWKVIFFRDQHLDHQQHIAFARQFGELTPGHVVFGNEEKYPEIYPVLKHRTAFAARPVKQRIWTDWHTDITAAINPPFGSILRAVVVPPYGGDTQWTNMVAAYQGLPPDMQQLVSTLRSVHQFMIAESGKDADAYNAKVKKDQLIAEHPLVTVHPETGENSLYTNSEFVKSIVGLEPKESQDLLEYLWEHCLRAEYMVRFRWKPGSIAFWDNRSTQHLAVRDVYDTDFEREFYRVTLNGIAPIGVDGQPSKRISGNPIAPV